MSARTRRSCLVAAVSLFVLASLCGCGGSGGTGGGTGHHDPIGEPRSVLVIHKGNPGDVPSKIQSTNLFQPVQTFDASAATPTLTFLRTFQCCLVMGDGPFDDSVALGDVLAQYVDEGGGVVLAGMFVLRDWAGEGLDGTFDAQNLFAIPETTYGNVDRGGELNLGITANMSSPLVTGGGFNLPIPLGAGDYGSMRPATNTFGPIGFPAWLPMVPGSVLVAHWNDVMSTTNPGGTPNSGLNPTPLIVARDISTSTGAISRRVDLGILPTTGAPGLVHPTAFRIYVNALLYVAFRI